ncbi:MAG: carbohydrate-binding protein, partial [Armatimonadota bacterium]|nr:carbohydrate-binding protein [Armatimonadota bacterium]
MTGPVCVAVLLSAVFFAVSSGAPASQATPLQARIDAAAPGSEIVVRGSERGPIVVRKPLRITGRPGAVIDGGGTGTVVSITSPGVVLTGVTLRGSGTELNTEDAGVYVTAPRAILQDIRMEDVLFGVNLKESHGTSVGSVTM